MKRRIKLTPILIAFILSLSASLTSCNDSETGTDSESVTVSQTEKETNTQSVTDTEVETDSITSEAPTDNIATEAPVEDTEAPETTVPETEAPETKPAVTTAPETTAPEVKKEYASKEEYPDDWGEENNMIRTDGKTFFWKKSRVMHTVPQGVPDARDWYIEFADEKNDQLFFVRRVISEDVLDYYSMVEGKFYKLNEGKVIFSWYDGTGPFYWIEEDGTAKSVNVRSKKYNEVYIEAEGVVVYLNPLNSFGTSNGEIIKPNSENILAKVKEIK